MLEAVAAIDIGTNSVHMVVARVADRGRFEVITRHKEVVRLGSGQGEMKALEPEAIERGIAALARCRALADTFGAEIVAVATSAVREALNRESFIERARVEAGVEVEVVSGNEEARLIHLGVLQAVPVYDRDLMMIDIGGGSTEVVLGRGADLALSRSMKLGAIRTTRRWFPRATWTPTDVADCRRWIRSRLASLVHAAEGVPREVVVGTSGTIEALVVMALTRRGDPLPRSLNAATVTRAELAEVVESIVAAGSVTGVRGLPGVDEGRVDILLAGALVLEGVLDGFGVGELMFSEYALREGVLLDAIERQGAGGLHHLTDLRRRSVEHLVELCDDDPAHALTVARLSLQLFDGLAGEVGLAPEDRELLEAAAMLANVGLFISHSGHHKHSYYVIRNSEHLMGFTDAEIESIALVARFHRRSAPSERKHPEFAALAPHRRAAVRAMAAILRVAIGLDRNHNGAVGSVAVSVEEDRVVISPRPSAAGDVGLERYAALERAGLLDEVMGRRVEVVGPLP